MPPTKSSPASTRDARRPRVLVVDDDLAGRVITSILLESAGCSPTAVASVERALARLDSGDVDLVVTDLVMPARGGLDLLESLRGRVPPLPSIVVTGAGDGALVDRAFELGARAVLPKPVPAQLLRDAVHGACGSKTSLELRAA
jgi:CheY-like chemotaxis protein